MASKKIDDSLLRASGNVSGGFLIPTVDPLSPNAPAVCTAEDIFKYLDSILGVDALPDYNDSAIYFKNQIVKRNGSIYRFIENKTRAGWGAADVVETDIKSELLARSVEKEIVTVTVTVDDDGFSVEDIVVACQTEVGTMLAQTDSNGQCTFEVEKGLAYSIAVNDVEGYDGIAPKEFTATKVSRQVSVVYTPLEDTEETNVEHVTVVLMKGNAITPSALTEASGLSVSYFIEGDSNMHKAKVGSDGRASFDVPYGATCTVEFPQVENFSKPGKRVFTAFQKERTLCSNFAFSTDNTDSFLLVADDGKEYSVENFAALSVQPTIVAFHINTPELRTTPSGLNDGKMCDFYIKSTLEVGSYAMQNANATITDMTTTTTNNTGNSGSCHFKYTGALDTKRLKDFMTQIHSGTWYNSPGWVNMISERTLTINGKTMQAFIPSFGQLWALRQLNAVFVSAQQIMHNGVMASIASGDWWSSTQYNANNMWRLSGGAAGNTSKTTACIILPVYN